MKNAILTAYVYALNIEPRLAAQAASLIREVPGVLRAVDLGNTVEITIASRRSLSVVFAEVAVIVDSLEAA